jgi:preprotein translocase subunit SecA
MAGRGTDIKLGSDVPTLGGLHVIGTERHESRRIDNQLRGRAGRQGDPGSSRFFVSFGDDIMKRFAPDWVPGMMQKLGMTEDMPLESRMVARAIEQAQTKVEGANFDTRKRLVEFDDVINEHRTVIYSERNRILEGIDTRANVLAMLLEEIEAVTKNAQGGNVDVLEVAATELREILPPDDVPDPDEMMSLGNELTDEVLDRAEDRFENLESTIGEENTRRVEHWLLLEAIDFHWREHLTAVEDLRSSIGLQAYAQIDPLVAFKREGYDMFQQLQENIRRQVARTVFKVQIVQQPPPAPAPAAATPPPPAPPEGEAARANGAAEQAPAPQAAPVLGRSTAPAGSTLRTNRDESPAPARSASTATAKLGRNDPCFCGSGKKYKKCHGALV